MKPHSPSPRKCNVRFCRTVPKPGRHRCEKCRRREWVKNNPIKDKYNKLKYGAKKRRIVFTLTLSDFIAFCKETGYVERCGRTAGSLSIDRKVVTRGYEKGNLQALTVSKNSLKYNFHDRFYRDPGNVPDDWIPEPEPLTMPKSSLMLAEAHELPF